MEIDGNNFTLLWSVLTCNVSTHLFYKLFKTEFVNKVTAVVTRSIMGKIKNFRIAFISSVNSLMILDRRSFF